MSLQGDALVAARLGITVLVVIQNGYAATTVTVEAGQTMSVGGIYKFIRHPMYVGNVIHGKGAYRWRSGPTGAAGHPRCGGARLPHPRRGEGSFTQELSGYRQYTQQVCYRLAPYVWCAVNCRKCWPTRYARACR